MGDINGQMLHLFRRICFGTAETNPLQRKALMTHARMVGVSLPPRNFRILQQITLTLSLWITAWQEYISVVFTNTLKKETASSCQLRGVADTLTVRRKLWVAMATIGRVLRVPTPTTAARTIWGSTTITMSIRRAPYIAPTGIQSVAFKSELS